MPEPLRDPPSCVLFDFDGTMYSFGVVYPRVWKQFYDLHHASLGGITFPDFNQAILEIYPRLPEELSGDPLRFALFDEVKSSWPDLTVPHEELVADHHAAPVQFMEPRPGLAELVRELDSHGVPWGIISNADSLNRKKLEVMELGSEPAAFILSEEVGVWKPEAEIFELAFEAIGAVERDAAVMVGDTVSVDIAGGKAAGMRTVLFADEPHKVKDHGDADALVGSMAELREFLFGE